jgi:hypothetical protein
MTPISTTVVFLYFFDGVSGGVAAVDFQARAGDEGSFGTGEIRNHAGDLVPSA